MRVKAGIPVTVHKRPVLSKINTLIEVLKETIGQVYYGEETIQVADDEFYLC